MLNLPEITADIPLVVIKAMTEKEILASIISLDSSGIALSKETLSDIMEIIKDFSFKNTFVKNIKNRELKGLLFDFYNIVPDEPVEYLRYLISKLTGESLIIKNGYLISKIKEADQKVLDKLITYAPNNLASIFFRYKPLFLAMKSVSKNKTFFNQLRKKADTLHMPIYADELSSVTSNIKSGELKFKNLKLALSNATIFRKIRLAYALNNRLDNGDSIVYKIRNGKGWVTDFEWSNKFDHQVEKSLKMVLDSIASDIEDNVYGKTFYIPSNIHYAIPATEKQFTGNFPTNSYVSVPEDLIVGIHWFNTDNRVDLDLSLIDGSGKYGWNGSYRSATRDLLFSGDITDAPRPNGAMELFYISKNIDEPKILFANYFNQYESDDEVDCKLIVAKEKPSKNFQKDYGYRSVRGREENYMVNVNNIIASANMNISKKQNVLGLIISLGNENRVYFSNTSLGNSIASSAGDQTNKIRDFYVRSCLNAIDLNIILSLAGAKVVDVIPDNDEEYVDLSPNMLDKSTIINLFNTSK